MNLSDKIDLVVPYVNMTDKNWQNNFNLSIKNNKLEREAITANRFRDQGNFFRFFFRGVEKNMPWINNLFLLVQNESEVPNWLDKTKVNIITHDQFIPQEYLPTFNSGTIEMFLQNIPGLGEYFIYANDDMFVLRPLMPEYFFKNQKLCFNLIQDYFTYPGMWQQMCQNNHDLIFGTQKAIPFLRLEHEFRPQAKSKMLECYNLHKDQILSNITQFRDHKNLTIFLYSLFYEKINIRQDTQIKSAYAYSTANTRILNQLLNTSDTICLNDTDEKILIYENPEVQEYFVTKFKNKSNYELNNFIFHLKKEKSNYLYF